MNMTNILIVDDNPNVLSSFKRALHIENPNWVIYTAEGGNQALEMVSRIPVDIIISDLRMPEMDGVELLTLIKEKSPATIRVAISGNADVELCEKAAAIAHQFIAKPCPPQEISRIINQTINLSNLVTNARVKTTILHLSNLPSQPNLYLNLINEINSPNVDIDRISGIISTDIGMSAKILQLVNSAYFGLAREVADISEAIYYLGIDTIRDLVFSIEIFSQFDQKLINASGLTGLWDHSIKVAICSKLITSSMVKDRSTIAFSFTGGLLHDVGKLILAVTEPYVYKQIIKYEVTDLQKFLNLERTRFGATHADIGGYLLGVWGLPMPIIQSVINHHVFMNPTSEVFTFHTAIWFSNYVACSILFYGEIKRDELLKPIGRYPIFQSNFDNWLEICQSYIGR
jgi:HD-like signal output (HDOD) protein